MNKNKYIIKVKGSNNIPTYIQLRDENFVLTGYFSYKEGRALRNMHKYGLEGQEEALTKVIESLPFGKIVELNLSDS